MADLTCPECLEPCDVLVECEEYGGAVCPQCAETIANESAQHEQELADSYDDEPEEFPDDYYRS